MEILHVFVFLQGSFCVTILKETTYVKKIVSFRHHHFASINVYNKKTKIIHQTYPGGNHGLDGCRSNPLTSLAWKQDFLYIGQSLSLHNRFVTQNSEIKWEIQFISTI